MTYDLTIARGKGCVGTITYSKELFFNIIDDGSTVWVQPSDEYYRNLGVSDTPAALAALHGMYTKTTPGTGLGKLADGCSLQSLLNNYLSNVQVTSMTDSAPTVRDGQRVVKLSDAASNAFAYATDTAGPELVQFVTPGVSQTAFDFAYPATPPVITPPPASRVIDGTKQGS